MIVWFAVLEEYEYALVGLHDPGKDIVVGMVWYGMVLLSYKAYSRACCTARLTAHLKIFRRQLVALSSVASHHPTLWWLRIFRCRCHFFAFVSESDIERQ